MDSVLAVTLGENLLVVFGVSTESFLRSRLDEYVLVLMLALSEASERLEEDRFLCDDLPSLPIAVKLFVEDEEYLDGVRFVSVADVCNSLDDPYLLRLLVDGDAVLAKFLLFI